MLFLYPLMLQAYRGVDFQPFLRGSIDGIPPAQMAALMKGSGLNRGVMSHVRLHSRLEASSAERAGSDVKGEMKKAKFSTELIRSNLKLRKLIERLDWKAGRTAWSEYREENTYSDADDRQGQVRASRDGGLALPADLGSRRQRRRLRADRRRARRLRRRARLRPRHR